MVVRPIPNLMVAAMDVFTKLFGNLLAFVYHCFDRIVIHGYLSALSRPEQALRPQSRRRSRGQQEDLEPAHRRLSELGGSLRSQPSHPDRVGREGRPQGRPRAALATPNGEQERLRRLFHLQEHGAGAELPHQRAEISHPRTRITASSPASAAATPTTTSTSPMRFSVRW